MLYYIQPQMMTSFDSMLLRVFLSADDLELFLVTPMYISGQASRGRQDWPGPPNHELGLHQGWSHASQSQTYLLL